MSLYTYDPDNVSVVLCGIPISGFAPDTFVSVEFNEDAFTLMVGADGESVRSKSNNRSARITVTLMQSSSSNDLLSAAHAADLITPSGDGIGPALVKDNSGTSLFAAEKSWIVKPATAAYGRETQTREWTCETDAGISNIGSL